MPDTPPTAPPQPPRPSPFDRAEHLLAEIESVRAQPDGMGDTTRELVNALAIAQHKDLLVGARLTALGETIGEMRAAAQARPAGKEGTAQTPADKSTAGVEPGAAAGSEAAG